MVKKLEDEFIIQLFFDRSESAIAEAREKYGKLCMQTARRILPDERDAEECVADALLRAWNAIPPERPRSLGAYITRVTRNLALDRYSYNTAEKRSTALTDAFEELETVLSAGTGIEQEAEDGEFKRFINAFLRGEREQARRYFVLRYLYGESIAEIAERCGVGEERIKSSLFRTRERLKKALEKEGVTV